MPARAAIVFVFFICNLGLLRAGEVDDFLTSAPAINLSESEKSELRFFVETDLDTSALQALEELLLVASQFDAASAEMKRLVQAGESFRALLPAKAPERNVSEESDHPALSPPDRKAAGACASALGFVVFVFTTSRLSASDENHSAGPCIDYHSIRNGYIHRKFRTGDPQ